MLFVDGFDRASVKRTVGQIGIAFVDILHTSFGRVRKIALLIPKWHLLFILRFEKQYVLYYF